MGTPLLLSHSDGKVEIGGHRILAQAQGTLVRGGARTPEEPEPGACMATLTAKLHGDAILTAQGKCNPTNALHPKRSELELAQPQSVRFLQHSFTIEQPAVSYPGYLLSKNSTWGQQRNQKRF